MCINKSLCVLALDLGGHHSSRAHAAKIVSNLIKNSVNLVPR